MGTRRGCKGGRNMQTIRWLATYSQSLFITALAHSRRTKKGMTKKDNNKMMMYCALRSYSMNPVTMLFNKNIFCYPFAWCFIISMVLHLNIAQIFSVTNSSHMFIFLSSTSCLQHLVFNILSSSSSHLHVPFQQIKKTPHT